MKSFNRLLNKAKEQYALQNLEYCQDIIERLVHKGRVAAVAVCVT